MSIRRLGAGGGCRSLLLGAAGSRRCRQTPVRRTPRAPTRASPACSGPSRASATTAWTLPRRSGCDTYDEPWTIDYPAAEQNLSRRVKTVTSIQVNDPVVITLEIPELCTYPWIYIVEPGNLRLKDSRGRRSCASSCCAAAR